jgi:hypothetical protein
MASLIYNSAIHDNARGLIDYDTDSFKAMLVTSAYVPNKDTHLKRSDVTNEVVGTNYTTGGVACAVTVTKDLTTDRTTIQFAAASWPSSTITARGCVYYKARGGASSSDEIVVYNDFGLDVVTSNGTLSVPAGTLTYQN